MANHPWAARRFPWLVSALILVAVAIAACTSDDDPRTPDRFDAGPAESYDPASITTFVDGVEIARGPLDLAGPTVIGGDRIFYLIRLQTGEFRAFDARDPHSDCWVVWDPTADPLPTDGTPTDGTPGWFRDPCHGANYDVAGARVFGPAPHGLDRHPTELRDGRLYINLAEADRIPGLPNVGSSDSAATPTPVATPTRPATIETSTPPPTTVWTAEDYLAALNARGFDVEPTGTTVACADVNGLPGTEYAGDARFTLWVYESATAAAAEWSIGDYLARHPVLDCNRAPARIYVRDNMVLWLAAAPPSGDRSVEVPTQVANTFLTLGNRPVVPHLHGFPIDRPAGGVPYGTVDLIDAAVAEGLALIPHADALCSDDNSTAERQHLVDATAGKQPSGPSVVLLVYPSAASVDSEWRIGSDGPLGQPGGDRQREPDCVGAARTIHIAANLVLLTQRPLAGEFDARLIRAFTSLTSVPQPR